MDFPNDNRSWAEICDEELEEEARGNANVNDDMHEEDEIENGCVDSEIGTDEDENDLEDGEIRDDSFAAHENDLEEGEIRDDSFAVPEPKYANISETARVVPSSTPLKLPSSASSLSANVESVYNPLKNALSYAKVVSHGIASEVEPFMTRGHVANEDLSLTSHLDVFHVDSPQKKADRGEPVLDVFLDEDTVMFSPCKSAPVRPAPAAKNTKRPFMLIDSPAREAREQTYNFCKIAKSEMGADVHTNTSTKSNVSSPSSKRELEVNPEVLVRRQKQIDYGKNTLGYERYKKAIPKSRRSKEHPKTPPKHLKMSRRAWDGLIKNWRVKLHRWDPSPRTESLDPDHANSDQFSVSSEDPSSYDSSSVRSDSSVSTPKKCLSIAEGEDGRDAWSVERGSSGISGNSKKLWANASRKSEKSDEDEFLGCEPLTENCVKACS